MAALRRAVKFWAWLLVATTLIATASAAEPKGPVAPISSTATIKAKSLSESVDEKFREKVTSVMQSPSITAKATDEEFNAHPNVYDWLVEHPDRTTHAWKRLKIPSVDITDLGKGQFYWSDDAGSELTWQTVGRSEHGVIWYATGKFKPGALLPAVPVKAVAVLNAPRGPADAKTGAATFKPSVQIYVQADSRMAAGFVKILGQGNPRMAEEGAEQFLFFFSGIARYLHRKPDQLEALLAPAKK